MESQERKNKEIFCLYDAGENVGIEILGKLIGVKIIGNVLGNSRSVYIDVFNIGNRTVGRDGENHGESSEESDLKLHFY
jgi:hypothetical protein